MAVVGSMWELIAVCFFIGSPTSARPPLHYPRLPPQLALDNPASGGTLGGWVLKRDFVREAHDFRDRYKPHRGYSLNS